MKKIGNKMKKICFILIFNLSFIFGFQAKAVVDKNNITIDDVINFKIELESTISFGDVNANGIFKDFDIISGPSQQTTMQWINGRMTNSKIMSWMISPKKIGKLIIPSLTLSIGGEKISTNKITIQVEKSKLSKKDLDVFISAELNKDKVYLGEQIILTYKIYRKVECSIEPFEIPKFPGFWAEEIFRPNQIKFKNISLNGVNYQEGTLYKVALFPISGKEHVLQPLSVKVKKQKNKKRNNRDPFFNPFFDSFFTETETKILKTRGHKVAIKKYPGLRPSGFTGGVGSFKIFTETDVDSTIVNEAVTFKILIDGTGNMGLFTLPEIKFSDEIDQFPPKERFEKNVFRDELSGKMTWEYILVPRLPGKLTIPPIALTYFNPKLEKWQRLTSKPQSVFVKKLSKNYLVNNGFTKRDIEVIGKDIKYIHMSNVQFSPIIQRSFSYAFYIYLLSVLILISPLLAKYVIGYNLDRLPEKIKNSALKKAIKSIENYSYDDSFDNSKIIYVFLKDRFQLSNANLDTRSISGLLKNFIPKDLLNELIELVKICDRMSYGFASLDDKKIVSQNISKILKKIDETC